ncbi:x96 protein [Methylibium sp. T29]|nr:x96 protein [Methylibium sp. T29]EWS60795.1 x96 protein [Methylibium sp. T29-B]
MIASALRRSPFPDACHRLNTETNEPDDDDASERPSKTALKKAMHELQALGEALMTLPDARIDAIGLDESLREAVRTAQRTKSHEGRRRQIQYLGKLMRRAQDAGGIEPIREAVASFQLGHAKDALALHEAERWRAELLASDDALTRWTAAHPRSDLQQLRSLIRSARKEAVPALPDGAARHGRAYRELFQQLRGALAEPGREEEESND